MVKRWSNSHQGWHWPNERSKHRRALEAHAFGRAIEARINGTRSNVIASERLESAWAEVPSAVESASGGTKHRRNVGAYL